MKLFAENVSRPQTPMRYTNLDKEHEREVSKEEVQQLVDATQIGGGYDIKICLEVSAREYTNIDLLFDKLNQALVENKGIVEKKQMSTTSTQNDYGKDEEERGCLMM